MLESQSRALNMQIFTYGSLFWKTKQKNCPLNFAQALMMASKEPLTCPSCVVPQRKFSPNFPLFQKLKLQDFLHLQRF